ncbi:uncharacterized protein K452DRAFT_232580 [Aplosporella prunicola CBS 121167]|uniref:Uncharacterized protein n=1 Tax=Aplosporella prunicola CBS 121167 TaxID=1176127 RepID=A0A6A6B836_9PEZI|nr:uncharacterized protein K452DRAFT_232580 [Aplosporella prunicola CBS 121167]KAF2139425.1 hypothetical protein K452DRAFT_232580 [Aplosporella prunicola CBS 121167]
MPSPEVPPQQPRRPQTLRRHHSSQSSQVSQSPSDSSHAGQQHRAAQHKAQRHIVGHGRLGQRNPSSKNLNKLGAAAKLAQADGQAGTRNHHRTLSGSSTATAGEAPVVRPNLKRNQSAAVVPRNQSHVALRKNHSSSHLPRQASSKNINKATRAELEHLRKQAKMRRRSSPETEQPVVRFDLGEEDEGEEEENWTEESASQSPATTRSNTRQNSVVMEAPKPKHRAQAALRNDTSDSATETETPAPKPKPKPAQAQAQAPAPAPAPPQQPRAPERLTYSSNHINGANSFNQQPQLPDADMITSRILQRSASHRLPPQVSDISATVVSDSHDARSLSHSTGSTMIDTPGNKEAVSRFINGEGSSGTPRDSSFLPHRPSSSAGGGDITPGKRNKSVPNMAGQRDEATPSGHTRSRSGTTTPSDLAPSRTQQKLWLQRASSNIEPQQKNEFLQRQGHGGSQVFTTAVTYTASGDMVVDRELLRRFDEATTEYRVVRRFRNPIADAIARLSAYPSGLRRRYLAMRATSSSGPAPPAAGAAAAVENGSANRRSKVSFDLPMRSRDDSDVGARRESGDSSLSSGSEAGGNQSRGPKDEVEELCRRIWERNEMAEGD